MSKNSLVRNESFLTKAARIHGDKYLYDKTRYVRSSLKVEVVCRSHGSFFVTPNNHISKQSGCPKCATILKAKNRQHSLSEFLLLAKQRHKNLYDYSKAAMNGPAKIKIICRSHGEFEQRPAKHLFGRGCPSCSKSKKDTATSFVEKAKMVHGETYDYSKVKYSTGRTPVEMICPIHGHWFQKPENHLAGYGCSACGRIMSHKEKNFLDIIQIPKSHRQYRTKCINYVGNVDGFKADTNTVYEFLGDFWHGNRRKYNLKEINPVNKLTFGELYNKTIKKFKTLCRSGYNVKYIWESQWDTWNKAREKELPIKKFIIGQPI